MLFHNFLFTRKLNFVYAVFCDWPTTICSVSLLTGVARRAAQNICLDCVSQKAHTDRVQCPTCLTAFNRVEEISLDSPECLIPSSQFIYLSTTYKKADNTSEKNPAGHDYCYLVTLKFVGESLYRRSPVVSSGNLILHLSLHFMLFSPCMYIILTAQISNS